jgi:hypothetical protein
MPALIRENWFLLAFLALIAAAFLFLRSKPTDIGGPAELEAALTDGRPTVVTFYSNF